MKGEPSTILVATDGSVSAQAAVAAAIDLAQTRGDRLVVVTAWRELRGDFGIPLHHVFPDLVDVERDRATEIAAAAAAEVEKAGIEAETVVRHGDAAEEICAVARERLPRMIVIGSRGWGSIGGLFFGSVSNGVLHHAPCPVLVVPGKEVVAERSGKARETAQAKERTLS